jgi:hypothetical protein
MSKIRNISQIISTTGRIHINTIKNSYSLNHKNLYKSIVHKPKYNINKSLNQ